MKDPRRLVLLIISLVFLTISGIALALGSSQPQWSILLRAGLLLGVVWLALPELSKLSLTRSWPFLAGAGILAVTIVSRPKLVPAAMGIFVVILVVNVVLRTIVKSLIDKQRRQ